MIPLIAKLAKYLLWLLSSTGLGAVLCLNSALSYLAPSSLRDFGSLSNVMSDMGYKVRWRLDDVSLQHVLLGQQNENKHALINEAVYGRSTNPSLEAVR